jgi:hypothetical protein
MRVFCEGAGLPCSGALTAYRIWRREAAAPDRLYGPLAVFSNASIT